MENSNSKKYHNPQTPSITNPNEPGNIPSPSFSQTKDMMNPPPHTIQPKSE